MKNKKESKIRTRIILDRQKDDGNWENIGLVLCVSKTEEEALLQPLCIDFSDEYVAILQKTITELKGTMKKVSISPIIATNKRRLKND
jgi:tetrahydromethanopterin S-methyltransferase subunit A